MLRSNGDVSPFARCGCRRALSWGRGLGSKPPGKSPPGSWAPGQLPLRRELRLRSRHVLETPSAACLPALQAGKLSVTGTGNVEVVPDVAKVRGARLAPSSVRADGPVGQARTHVPESQTLPSARHASSPAWHNNLSTCSGTCRCTWQ